MARHCHKCTFLEGVCITASGNIPAGGNLCFRIFKIQLKVINKNVCFLNSVWVNQINESCISIFFKISSDLSKEA